jgi:hypothetical protein
MWRRAARALNFQSMCEIAIFRQQSILTARPNFSFMRAARNLVRIAVFYATRSHLAFSGSILKMI